MPIYHFFQRFSLDHFFRFITDFGNVHYLLFFVFCSFFLLKNKRDWKFLVSMMLFEVLTNIVLKNFFSRPRPSVLWLVEETGFSFPSGHMMAATMFYGLCIYFLFLSHQKRFIKVIGYLFFCSFILLIGISRIYLGVHYASDILGGFLVSLCLLCFGIFFYQSMYSIKDGKTEKSVIYKY